MPRFYAAGLTAKGREIALDVEADSLVDAVIVLTAQVEARYDGGRLISVEEDTLDECSVDDLLEFEEDEE